ncbi:MFS transporter [Pseudomonas sp. SDO528_S397]
MDSVATHDAPAATGKGHRLALSRGRSVAAVLALSLGCFSFVSTELMPVGVLPAMADGLEVSLGQAGYLVSCFALVVALTAAPLTGLLSSINRKALMAILLAVCCAGNLVTYLAPSYAVVLVGRVLVAAAIGVFWSTAVVTAAHLVHARNAVRATSIVFAGVSLATVLGVPAGTILGEHQGWRAVFAALTMLSLLLFMAVAWSVPVVRIGSASIRGAMARVLKNGPLLAVFAATALIATGNFMAYTYITPYLEQVAQMNSAHISVMLLVYGGAGVVANFAVGPFAGQSLGLPGRGDGVDGHRPVADEPGGDELQRPVGNAGDLGRSLWCDSGAVADVGIQGGCGDRGRGGCRYVP